MRRYAGLLAQRTTIVIAHRISTIALASRVLGCLDEGHVIAEWHARGVARARTAVFSDSRPDHVERGVLMGWGGPGGGAMFGPSASSASGRADCPSAAFPKS